MKGKDLSDIQELYNLVKKYYGYKAKMMSINHETREVVCVLYDSFWMQCGFYDRYGLFGAGLDTGGEGSLTNFLGKQSSLNKDPESIKNSLKIIDDYCRMRLPDKFLNAYHKAYALS